MEEKKQKSAEKATKKVKEDAFLEEREKIFLKRFLH